MRARTHCLIIRLWDEELRILKVSAGKGGLSVSDHARRLLGLPVRAKREPVGVALGGPAPGEKPRGSQGTPG